MPRATFGNDVKARVKRLFAVLMSLSDVNEDNCGIIVKWHKSGSEIPKLVVKTTLRHLEALTKKDGQGHLSKSQIREALQRMEDFLEILADNRLHKRGTENWDFTLTPWFTESTKNLEKFDVEWDNRRPKKSKQAAATTQKEKTTKHKPSCFCQAQALPQYFVERPEQQEAVKNLLLSQAAERPGTLVVSAIYGLGGIGKSTLAAALAHNLEVQTYFPDGILWVTLGQNPDLLPLLSGWIQRLEDYNYKPVTVNDASKHLQTLLYDKKALLVVDDAWNPEHVEPFRVGGSNCRVLVTTREAVIKGATRYDLDVLTPDESLELLQKYCGSLKLDELQLAQNLADTVGCLPLALDLAASQIAEGVTWAELLKDLRAEIAYLEALNLQDFEKSSSEEKGKHYSLIASFNLSLRSLTPEMLQQFAWFGVLPEDVNITPAMAATLWDITPRQALTTLRTFKTKALLLPGITLNEQQSTYRLHDLMHDMAVRCLTSEPSPHNPHELPGLGLKLAQAHSQLLERYQKKTKSGLWHTLEDDGYIYANLSWHLEKAQRVEDLHQLLQEETETGHNGWYEACDRLGQTANFVTDVARAWQLAEADWTLTTLPQVIGLQCRYALIIASLNSLAANLPVKLLIALLKKNVWTPSQGLAYVLQSSNPKYKANLLTELVNCLSPNLKELALRKALTAAREIQFGEYRADALSSLAPLLPPELLTEAVAAAREIQDQRHRANVLSSLAPLLPQLLSEAVVAAREIQDQRHRANALSSLAPLLPQLLSEAVVAAREIQDHRHRANALSSLASLLPSELLPEALAAAREIQSGKYRANALSSLAPKLPPELLPEALAAAREIEDYRHRADALSTSSLALQLLQVQKTLLFSLWRDTLHILSVHTRPNLLSDINALIPVIFTLGGQQAVKDTASAIQDVSRWWG